MGTLAKPYSESCEQNRLPIIAAITPLLAECRTLLEIGSGTGQHAVYFAEALGHLTWQTSDRREHHVGIAQWLAEARLANIRPPLALDVAVDPWPVLLVDAVFSANTAHIMHWHEVEALFAGVGRVLRPGGIFLLYGPFNYHSTYTSESNARFDSWLKGRDPAMGIRDVEAICRLAEQAGMVLRDDLTMPANNRILYWEKRP